GQNAAQGDVLRRVGNVRRLDRQAAAVRGAIQAHGVCGCPVRLGTESARHETDCLGEAIRSRINNTAAADIERAAVERQVAGGTRKAAALVEGDLLRRGGAASNKELTLPSVSSRATCDVDAHSRVVDSQGAASDLKQGHSAVAASSSDLQRSANRETASPRDLAKRAGVRAFYIRDARHVRRAAVDLESRTGGR